MTNQQRVDDGAIGQWAREAEDLIDIDELVSIPTNQEYAVMISAVLTQWLHLADKLGLRHADDDNAEVLQRLKEYITHTAPEKRCPCKRRTKEGEHFPGCQWVAAAVAREAGVDIGPQRVSAMEEEDWWPLKWKGKSLLRYYLDKLYVDTMFNDPWVTRIMLIEGGYIFQMALLKPMIAMGHDVNAAGTHVLDNSHPGMETELNLFAYFIANGLMDFTCTEPYSPAHDILINACNSHGERRIREIHKAHLLCKLLHSLGASEQLTQPQKDSERNLMKHLEHTQRDEAYGSLAKQLESEIVENGSTRRTQVHQTLEAETKQRCQPRSLSELSRVGVRRGVGGRWFAAKVAVLPLPAMLKDFVTADLALEFERA